MLTQPIATIDLGTNSIHLLIVRMSPAGKLETLYDTSEVVRMGQGLRESGRIHPDAITRTRAALARYQKHIEEHACGQVFMTTTSAVREARNQYEVLQALHADIDYKIEVIGKEEEARLSYLSIVSDLPEAAAAQDPPHYLVADIGGGSTEIAWGRGRNMSKGQSVKIGTVKLLEGPLAGETVNGKDVAQAIEEVKTHFTQYDKPPHIDRFFGTAGSFTQLAALEQKLTSYCPERIEHFALTKDASQTWIKQLTPLCLQEKQQIPGMHPKRADVALAGAIIALCLFDFLENQTFHIRDRGIRFGKAYDVLLK